MYEPAEEELETEQVFVVEGEEQYVEAGDEELFYEDAGVAEDGAVAEEMIVDGEAAVEEVVYAEEEVAATEELAAEEGEEFFIDTGDAVAETEALQEEVVEEASFVEVAAEEIVYEEVVEEAIAEEIVYEEVIEEAAVEEVAAEEQVEFVEEGVVYEEAAVVEEAAEEEAAVAEEGDFFVMDTAGEEEVPAEEAVAEEEVAAEEMEVEAQEVAAEEAVVEEVFYEEEAAVEEVAAEEVLFEEVVAAEGEEAFVEDTTGMDIVEEAPAEDAAAMEIVEEFEQIVAAQEAAAEEALAEEGAEEGGEEQLLGNIIADSFSTSFDDDGTAEEPASKKQKLAGELSLPIARRTAAPQEDDAILLDSPTGFESPVGDSAPNDLEDDGAGEAVAPASPSSPTSQLLFRAPKSKWSGASPPPSLAGEKRASPEVSNVVSKAGVAKKMVMPATSKGAMPATSKGAPPKQPFKASAFKGGSFPPQAVAKPPFAAKWGGAAPGGTPGKAMSSSLNKAQGYVFVCNNQTMAEVANRKLVGSPDREFAQMQQHIKPNTSLYLMNFDTLKIYGPFAPDGVPEQRIVQGAFGGRFNAQLRVKPTEKLIEAQVEKRIPAGPKDPSGMRQITGLIDSGSPAAPDVRGLWFAGASVGGAMPPASPPAANRMLTPSFNSPMVLPGSPINMGINTPKQIGVAMRGMVRPTLGALNMPKAGGGGQMPGMDKEGRRYDLNVVVVNFANIGATYASKVLKKDKSRGDRLFCWEGVRKAVKHITQDLGLEAVGCVFENYKGPDNGGIQVPIPADIRQMCKSIQETPSLTGKNQKSADDEMTIKCAYRRNCRFIDNDNYRDWLREMRKPEIRAWLESCQEMLQMRYFFDNDLGTFDTLDGNVPVGLLDPNNAAARVMRR